MIAACIDRWALCSNNVNIRAFSKPNKAIRVILILLVVWTIIPIHLAIFYNNSTGRCIASSAAYAFFYAIYSLIVIGVLPLVLMIVFSFLAWYNLRLTRTRVAPIIIGIQNIKIRKRDRDLMKMLTGEVFVYCLTTIPYPINLIYSVSTVSISAYKSAARIAIESLIGYIISPILNFMYCCVQFYGKKNNSYMNLSLFFVVYIFCSRKFRKQFIKLFRRQQEGGNSNARVTAYAAHPSTRH